MTMTVDDEIDLAMRAPYIPMNEQDDLPLLPDDLMWSAFSEELSIQKDDAMQYDTIRHQLHQQQQQTCNTNKNLINFHHNQQQTDPLPIHSPTHMSHQQSQQSMCSSPASSILSLSPSPSLNNPNQNHQQHNHHHQQQQQRSISNHFSSESSLATLLCGTGSISDDNDSGIGSIGNSMSPQQNHQQQNHLIGTFKLQSLHHQLQQNDEHHHHHQQTQQQHSLHNSQQRKSIDDDRIIINNTYKKDNTSNLCDSIDDAFDNVYDDHKDCK